MLRKFLIIFSVVAISIVLASLYFFSSDFFHNRIASPLFSRFSDRVIYSINPLANLTPRSGSDENTVDIKLSPEDIEFFSNLYRNSVAQGNNSLIDSQNQWRDAKIYVGGTKYKIKTKIHGTSLSPYHASKSMTDKILGKIVGKLGGAEITDGGFAFKVKLKKESREYYNLMRRVNYLSPYDDWSVATISINKYANQIGLISPHGRLVRLRINGVEIGPYMEVEQHGKEFLERNYGVTSYAILKSNDDWDKSVNGHATLTDFYSQDKEQDGLELVSRVSLTKLDELFLAIKESDLKKIRELVDYDYMSKYLAWLSIVNNIHGVTGDNLKYIYDFSLGKFRIMFRVEDGVKKIRHGNDIAFFGEQFTGDDYPNKLSPEYVYKFFRLMLSDKDFIRMRNHHLSSILADSDKIIDIFESDFIAAKETLDISRFPVQEFFRQHKHQMGYLRFNLEYAKRYISHGKVFVSNYFDHHGNGISSKVLVESAVPLVAKRVIGCTNQEREKGAEIDIPAFDKLSFSAGVSGMSLHEYDFNFCIKEMYLFNQKTNLPIDQADIHYNEGYISIKPMLLHEGDNISVDSIYTDKAGVLHIPEGKHRFNTDTILKPISSRIVIHPGASIELEEGASLILKGSVNAKGREDFPISVRKSGGKNFGTFAIVGNGMGQSDVVIDNLHVDGGNESIVDGVYYSGQMAIYDADVEINNSTFKNSASDDGLNIKRSKVSINKSVFSDNAGDQLDCDFCFGAVNRSVFSSSDTVNSISGITTDGLDVSGAHIKVMHSEFDNLSDKGISIGEGSTVRVENSSIQNSRLGIAIKDGSNLFLPLGTRFQNNVFDLTMYIKKKFFGLPHLYFNTDGQFSFEKNEGIVHALQE